MYELINMQIFYTGLNSCLHSIPLLLLFFFCSLITVVELLIDLNQTSESRTTTTADGDTILAYSIGKQKWQMTKSLVPQHCVRQHACYSLMRGYIKQTLQRHLFEKILFVPVIIYYVHCMFTSSVGWSWGLLSSVCPSSAFDSRSARNRKNKHTQK